MATKVEPGHLAHAAARKWPPTDAGQATPVCFARVEADLIGSSVRGGVLTGEAIQRQPAR